MDQSVIVFDFQRMLFGDQPPAFLLEIVFRTLVIYAYTLLLLRWLGSRTVGQLSTVEFLLVIALGSAVGDAMFYPDVPLLHAMVVVTVIVVSNKVLDVVIATNRGAEKIIDGEPREVVRDGVLTKQFLVSKTVSRDELFQQLREDGIEHLGEIWRAYLEKDGQMTVFRSHGTSKGLRIVPPAQVEPYTLLDPHAFGEGLDAVCTTCGNEKLREPICDVCQSSNWTLATKSRATVGPTSHA